ncbi:MAG: copper resistance protein B [Gammaproteobacteria bacterium]|nr:copper resistance protein B [Gammaproteobacteria bacterium]MDH5304042.1 copper resistance protein B [Gammaproteobacteria bacterium]MDH5321687.1 copper resistance protein B [Gammaproteobacteria bacterium]
MTRSFATVLLFLAAIAGAEEARFTYLSADRIEYQSDVERSVWDVQGWYGTDLHRLWWKLEGSNASDTDNELQLLYSRAVSPYFDAQIGVSVADNPADTDTAFVIGIMGLAPYNIEIDIAASVNTDGDYQLHGEFTHDIRFSEHFVLQPRLELRARSAAEDQAALEMRLRYEINRNIAPYLGLSWQNHFNDSAPGDATTVFIAGLGFWF